MPILEFQCKSKTCQHVFERITLGQHTPNFICPKCQGEETRKVKTFPAVIKFGHHPALSIDELE